MAKSDADSSDTGDLAPDRPGREPKYVACKRLGIEGRYVEFRKRVAWYRTKAGGGKGRDEAFYAALAEFPPRGVA